MEYIRGGVAVVTGGGAGIGRGICVRLAQLGCNIVVADIRLDKAEEVVREIQGSTTVKAIAVRVDVACAASVRALAETAYHEFGFVSILANNAGVAAGKAIHNCPEETWDWVMTVNVKSVYLVSREFIPRMLSTGRPSCILNTGSEVGLGMPTIRPSIAYLTSKHAVVGMSDAMRRHYHK